MIKKALLIIFSLFYVSKSSAQIIEFEDPQLKAALLSANSENLIANCAPPSSWGDWSPIQSIFCSIDTNNDGEIQVSEAQQITGLDISYLNISSLVGLEYFVNLRYLYAHDNQLTSLNLSSFPYLISVLISNNPFIEISIPENSDIKEFVCGNCFINGINLNNLINVQVLEINNNNLSSIELISYPKLSFLNLDNNQLTIIDASYNGLLETIYCQNNSNLERMFLKNGIQEEIYIAGCPNLNYLCGDDEELVYFSSVCQQLGYYNCQVNTYCKFTPGGKFTTIHGTINYFDTQENCMNNGLPFKNAQVKFIHQDYTALTFTNENGQYVKYGKEGDYMIVPNTNNADYEEFVPLFAQVHFPYLHDFVEERNFCLVTDNYDLSVNIIPSETLVPGFTRNYRIIYNNYGIYNLDAIIQFQYDNQYLVYQSATHPPISIENGLITWHHNNFLPNQSGEFRVNLRLNSPIDTPPVFGGETFPFQATISPVENDVTPDNNHHVINLLAVNSYDPNDITCLEGEEIPPTAVGNYVHYLIRFENIGTYYAQNVVIKNEIDITKFDIESIYPIEASHPYRMSVTNQNRVEFIFEDIMLDFPPSDLRHGYVLYKIKTKPNLTIGDSFANSAEIYFDFNWPIYTNVFETVIQENLSVPQPIKSKDYVILYPIPAGDILNLNSTVNIKEVFVYDVNGRQLKAILDHDVKSIDISDLSNGIYMLKIISDNKIQTQLFTKKYVE